MTEKTKLKSQVIRKPTVSIVTTAWNEDQNLRPLVVQVCDVFDDVEFELEMIVVDNGSVDRTLEIVKEIGSGDPRIKYLSLSRNFGHQGGLIAGMEMATGDAIITIDCDLQHPPEMIPKLIDKWQEGYEVVNTTREFSPDVGAARKCSGALFYWIVSRLSGIPLNESQSDFRLLDRKAADAMLSLPEGEKFIRGLSHWIGYKHISIAYRPGERFAGESKFNFPQLFNLAVNGVTSFSIIPLRTYVIFGVVLATACIIYGGKIIISYIMDPSFAPPGWTTLVIGMFFLGGVQLIGIGILGEYLGRILNQTRKRPTYLVKESSDETE